MDMLKVKHMLAKPQGLNMLRGGTRVFAWGGGGGGKMAKFLMKLPNYYHNGVVVLSASPNGTEVTTKKQQHKTIAPLPLTPRLNIKSDIL